MATSMDGNDDTASMVSGGGVTQASDGDYEASTRPLEERIRDSIRPLEERLRALTDEHRTGSVPSIGQRLVQLEHEMLSRRWAMERCGCSERDPLWEIFVGLVCTTLVFVLLRWVEGRLWAHKPADSDDRRMLEG